MTKRSTSLLLYGYDPVTISNGSEWIEYDSLYGVKGFEKNLSQKSVFWRSLIRRQWQYDDFNGHMAAAQFIKSAHKYKIWFNPYEMYKNSLSWDFNIINENEKDPKIIGALIEKSWREGLETGHYPNVESSGAANINWDYRLAKGLQECKEKGEWDDHTWKLWSDFIYRNSTFRNNLCCVFMHEVQHIISEHLIRVGSKNSFQWNIATDYAMNQNIPFSTSWSKHLISDYNKTFYKEMVGCICRWLCITDDKINKDMEDKFSINRDMPVEVFQEMWSKLEKEYILENLHFRKNNKFHNKTANFYYEVITSNDDGEGGCGISQNTQTLDEHCEWEGISSSESGEGEGEAVGEGEVLPEEGEGEGDKSEGDKNSPNSHGKGFSRHEHKGFDRSLAANEAKQGVRKSLEAAGYDISTDEEIDRALAEIPHLQCLGHLFEEWFKVKKSNWKRELTSQLKTTMNATSKDFTLKREHKAIKGAFPGKMLLLGLDIVIITDTSGSIVGDDWNDFANQIYYISKDCDIRKTRLIQCHDVVSFDQYVDLRKIKKVAIKEIGGTRMEVALEKLKKEKNRKTTILFTDGDISRIKQANYGFKVIIFLSRGHSHNKQRIESWGFKVICQDNEA